MKSTLLLLSILRFTAEALQQREILSELYERTGGDNWINSDNWNSDEKICKWYGIQCPGGYNGDTEMVSAIDLRSNNLNGTVPFTHLLLLQNLENLYLNDNELEYPDAIDEAIVDGNTIYSALKHVELSGTDVHHLDGVFGTVGGSVTVDLFKLSVLYLNDAHMGEEGFPEILFTLVNLEKLFMDHNHLSGTIPDQIEDLEKLEYLSLKGNDITGTIPSWLGGFSRMKYLDLAENILTGSIPASLDQLNRLFHLDLSNEDLRGEGLSGPLPTFSNAESLLHFDLAHNSLTGTIPDNFLASVSMDNVGLVSLHANQLTGEIPSIIGQLDAVLTDNWFDDSDMGVLCDNGQNFIDAFNSYGCDGILCEPYTWNAEGRQRDENTPCLPCPMAEDSNLGHTTCPSQAPSMVPSSTPSVSAVPSVAPSISFMPSINIMMYWNIAPPEPEEHPHVVAKMEEDTPSVDVNLRIGNIENIVVSIYEADCLTGPVTTDLLETSFTYSDGGYTHGYLLSANVAIHAEHMKSSTFWDTATSSLEFCVRSELRELGTDRSITYQDTKLKFEINMAAGFSVKNIVANNLDVKMETTQSQTFHSVSACVCDEYIHVCKTAEENFELTQNMVYSLCLSATSSDVEVKAVNTLTIVQDGEEKFWPIAGQAPNSLSKVNYENGLAVVTTRSISSFFSISPPPEIKAVGEVELSFVSAQSSERRLERKLQTDNESFEVDIRLGMSADEESGVGRVLRLFVSLMSPIAFIVAIVF